MYVTKVVNRILGCFNTKHFTNLIRYSKWQNLFY